MNGDADYLLAKNQVLDCLSNSIEIKVRHLNEVDPDSLSFKRVKESVSVDLRKIHDMGPHLASRRVVESIQGTGININLEWMQNTLKNKDILGRDKKLQLEHVFPVRQIVSLVLRSKERLSIKELIISTSCTAWILASEDQRIKEKSHRPSPMRTYRNAGIDLLEMNQDGWHQFDWSAIERWAED